MAESVIQSGKVEIFSGTSRNSRATSGALTGFYFPDTGFVLLYIYFTSNDNVGTSTLFTIAEKYRPATDKDGAGLMMQAASGGNNHVGNIRVKSNGDVQNAATTTCYKCFGIIGYNI